MRTAINTKAADKTTSTILVLFGQTLQKKLLHEGISMDSIVSASQAAVDEMQALDEAGLLP